MIKKVGVVVVGKEPLTLKGVLGAPRILQADDVCVLRKQPLEPADFSGPL